MCTTDKTQAAYYEVVVQPGLWGAGQNRNDPPLSFQGRLMLVWYRGKPTDERCTVYYIWQRVDGRLVVERRHCSAYRDEVSYCLVGVYDDLDDIPRLEDADDRRLGIP